MKYPSSIRRAGYASPLGNMTLAVDADALVGAWFDGQNHQPETHPWPELTEHPVLRQARRELAEYFAGRRTRFDVPLAFACGTDFQQAVWRELQRIPYGTSTSYGAISAAIGRATAVRAVGTAVGRNPLGIIVPCHRVLGADGSLTGYAGGLERKIALLRLEGVSFRADPKQEQRQGTL